MDVLASLYACFPHPAYVVRVCFSDVSKKSSIKNAATLRNLFKVICGLIILMDFVKSSPLLVMSVIRNSSSASPYFVRYSVSTAKTASFFAVTGQGGVDSRVRSMYPFKVSPEAAARKASERWTSGEIRRVSLPE